MNKLIHFVFENTLNPVIYSKLFILRIIDKLQIVAVDVVVDALDLASLGLQLLLLLLEQLIIS